MNRPTIDLQSNLTCLARSNPDLTGLDRLEAAWDVDALAGRGWTPQVGFSWHFSERFASVGRSARFLRNLWELRLFLWHWLSGGHRVSWSANADYILDLPSLIPAGTLPLSMTLQFAYDYTGRRGLMDYSTRPLFFLDRLAEEGGRIRRTRPMGDAAWEPTY